MDLPYDLLAVVLPSAEVLRRGGPRHDLLLLDGAHGLGMTSRGGGGGGGEG